MTIGRIVSVLHLIALVSLCAHAQQPPASQPPVPPKATTPKAQPPQPLETANIPPLPSIAYGNQKGDAEFQDLQLKVALAQRDSQLAQAELELTESFQRAYSLANEWRKLFQQMVGLCGLNGKQADSNTLKCIDPQPAPQSRPPAPQ